MKNLPLVFSSLALVGVVTVVLQKNIFKNLRN
jgi:hypothetical protein